MQQTIGSFQVEVGADGVALVIFSRPPVNAVSISVYEDIGRLADELSAGTAVRAVLLTAPGGRRGWWGGGDLKDFIGMNPEKRKDRYRFINAQLPKFYELDRPVIAAINGPAIGIGMVWSGLCDMRIAAEDACF